MEAPEGTSLPHAVKGTTRSREAGRPPRTERCWPTGRQGGLPGVNAQWARFLGLWLRFLFWLWLSSNFVLCFKHTWKRRFQPAGMLGCNQYDETEQR